MNNLNQRTAEERRIKDKEERNNRYFIVHGQKVFVGLQEHLQPNDASIKSIRRLN